MLPKIIFFYIFTIPFLLYHSITCLIYMETLNSLLKGDLCPAVEHTKGLIDYLLRLPAKMFNTF